MFPQDSISLVRLRKTKTVRRTGDAAVSLAQGGRPLGREGQRADAPAEGDQAEEGRGHRQQREGGRPPGPHHFPSFQRPSLAPTQAALYDLGGGGVRCGTSPGGPTKRLTWGGRWQQKRHRWAGGGGRTSHSVPPFAPLSRQPRAPPPPPLGRPPGRGGPEGGAGVPREGEGQHRGDEGGAERPPAVAQRQPRGGQQGLRRGPGGDAIPGVQEKGPRRGGGQVIK